MPLTKIRSESIDASANLDIDSGTLFVDSVNNRIGIKTSSPSNDLTVNGTAKITGSTVIEVTDNTNAALRITQLGTGNAILVEDSTNPDSTPFVVDADGRLLLGQTVAAQYNHYNGNFPLQLSSISSLGAQLATFSATPAGLDVAIAKSRAATVGTNTIVQNGDTLGNIQFLGADGSGYWRAAQITAQVDGTPGTNDMPGRLIFSTTADGAFSPTERMRIDSSGNVGIGTSSPSVKLDVVGSAKISSDTIIGTGANGTAPTLVVNGGTDGSNGPVILGRGNGNNEWLISSGRSIVGSGAAGLYDYVYGNNPRVFYTNGSERMRIDGSGNVGIGTDSPSQKFHVVGNILSTPSTWGSSGTGYVYLGDINNYVSAAFGGVATFAGYSTLTFGTTVGGYSEKMRITSAGDVGIGTSSPSLPLHVYRASGASQVLAESVGSTGSDNGSFQAKVGSYSSYLIQYGTGYSTLVSYGTELNIAQSGAYPIKLRTNDTERLRITSTGLVGIGTDSPSQLLHVAGVTWLGSSASATTGTLGIYADGASNVTIEAFQANNINVKRDIQFNRYGGNSSFYGNALVVSTGGLGYGTGSGGTVTQATSKSTAVTLNKTNGLITTHAAALAAGASVSFTVNNTTVAAADVIILNNRWGNFNGEDYRVEVMNVTNAKFAIRITNISSGSLSQALTLNFAVINGVTS